MNKLALFIGLACLCLNVAAAVSDPEWRYTIRPGDTLIGFSQQHLVRPADWRQLQRLNHVANPRRLVPGQTLRVPLALLKQSLAPAEVLGVSGRVQARLANSAPHALAPGEKLGAGVELQTEADSSATLRFADGSVVVMQPASRMQLDTVSIYQGGGMVDTRLRLQQGRAEVTANPRHGQDNNLQVITPSAVAAVRGTRFRVDTDGDTTREETLQGQVGLLAAAQEVAVAGGYGSIVRQGQAPLQPVPLLGAPALEALPARLEYLPLRFKFSGSPGAQGWIGQIAPQAAFDSVLLEKTSDRPVLTFADLPDGSYVLRVRARDALGLQGADALHAFELDARPYAPLLLEPADHAVVRTARPGIKWSEAKGGDSYRVQLARNAEFSDMVLDTVVTQTQFAPMQDLAPGDYFLRLASIEQADQGPFSAPVGMTYKPLAAAPDLAGSALAFDAGSMTLNLPEAPEGMRYEAELAEDEAREKVLWQGEGMAGQLRIPRPAAGKRYLSVRLVEADGTAGPYATQVIDVPRQSHGEWLLLLLPLLAL